MNTWDIYFIKLAKEISTKSKDPSTQTGAVIVRPDNSIASVGFNGFPARMPDVMSNYVNREEKYSRIIHCEMNALIFSRDASHSGYSLYTYPFPSCDRCFVHMVQAGIMRFVSPKPSEEHMQRWGEAFERVRKYARECEVTLMEIDRGLLQME
jgi:dCMP deaminase